MNTLKSIRNELGFTQKELAEFFNISRSHVAKLELDMRIIPTGISLLAARIQIALLHFHPSVEASFINNASQQSDFQKQKSKVQNNEKLHRICLQQSKMLHVISELRNQYTEKRLQIYFDMIEANAKWKIGCTRELMTTS